MVKTVKLPQAPAGAPPASSQSPHNLTTSPFPFPGEHGPTGQQRVSGGPGSGSRSLSASGVSGLVQGSPGVWLLCPSLSVRL